MTYRISDEIEDALTPEVIAAGWDKFREGRQSQPMLQLLAGGPGLKEVFIAMAAAMRGFRIVRADETKESGLREARALAICYLVPDHILVAKIDARIAELDKESEPKK